MSHPDTYVPLTDYGEVLGNSLGTKLDAEFIDVSRATTEIISRLSLIQRDDGKLANESVHPDALASATLAMMGGSWEPRGEWATSTLYQAGDVVSKSEASYVATTQHVSGNFNTDLTLAKWVRIAGAEVTLDSITGNFTMAGTLFFTPNGRIDLNRNTGVADPGIALAVRSPADISGVACSLGSFIFAPIPAGVGTTFLAGIFARVDVPNLADTYTEVNHIYVADGNKGAAATITNWYGVNVGNPPTVGTRGAGIRLNTTAGSGRWNVYAIGTAANLFAGPLQGPDGSAGAPSYSFNSATDLGLFRPGANQIDVSIAGSSKVRFTSTGPTVHSGDSLSWGSAGVNTPDVLLARDGANTLALRNGANAQQLRVANTFTDASNFEYGRMVWTSNTFQIDTVRLGAGVARALRLGTDGTGRWDIGTAGHLTAVADNTYDIGASGATRPRNVYVGGAVYGSVLDSNATSGVSIRTNNGTTVAVFAHILNAVNSYQFEGGVSGSEAVTARTTGTDADVSFIWVTKGAGLHRFFTNSGGPSREQFQVLHVASAVNYITVQGSATGNNVQIATQGTDANISINLVSKGSGNVRLVPNTGDILWGKALVALGGGAAPTLGTIGGSGPATAAQNSWMRVLDSGGAAFWVPAWK